MKRMETYTKKIGENTFYIKKFPAFTAANVTGVLTSTVLPALGGLASIFGGNGEVLDLDLNTVLPDLANSLSSLDGSKMEMLFKKLLTEFENISVNGADTDSKTELLTDDLADEIFCGELQDMLLLGIEVIKLNFTGFFKKLGTQFGNLRGKAEEDPSLNALGSLM